MSGVAWYEDWGSYIFFHSDEEMNEESLRSWVRQFKGTQVKEFFMNPNGMRSSYRSKVFDYMIEGYDPNSPDKHLFFTKLEKPVWKEENASPTMSQEDSVRKRYLLDQKGINMYSIWTDECRKCKISPWISMRMNDGHGARDETHFYHSKFWREHPEYRRAEYRYTDNSNFESRWAHTPLDRLLDYAHPQVREYQMAYIKECLEMYDVDGIDLDFLRYEYCFRPGFEEQGIEIMNAFIKEAAGYVKEWEQKRGHAIGLGVRVSVDPQMALSFGFDVYEWARQGWITRVTPMQHYTNAFLGAPYKLWKRLLDGTKVTLCGGTDIGVCAGSGCQYGKISSAVTRAAACSMLYKGVERIFLFNFWPGYSLIKDYLELVSQAGSLDTLKGLHKRYLVSFVDSEVPGEASARMLPLDVKAGRVHDVRIHLGKIEGETLRICIGAPAMKEEELCFKIRLNGVDCPYQGTADMPLPNPAHAVFTFMVPSSVAHNGYNNIEIVGLGNIAVDWVEVEACYNK